MIELDKAITKAMKGFSIQENARERSRMMDYKLCKDQLVEETCFTLQIHEKTLGNQLEETGIETNTKRG